MPTHLAYLVLARFLSRCADQAPGNRKRVRDLAQPINKPRGVSREVVRDFGQVVAPDTEGLTEPDRKDIQPKDVFSPTPNDVGVLNLWETGEGLTKSVQRRIDRDKGHDVVDNLSQYLIRTDGGGSGGPEGKKS